VITAAPAPIRARVAIRPLAESTWQAVTEAAPKSCNPDMSRRRRPKRSPSTPAGSKEELAQIAGLIPLLCRPAMAHTIAYSSPTGSGTPAVRYPRPR